MEMKIIFERCEELNEIIFKIKIMLEILPPFLFPSSFFPLLIAMAFKKQKRRAEMKKVENFFEAHS
jgi:hypothetical protein